MGSVGNDIENSTCNWVVTWSHKLRLLPVVQGGLACGCFRHQEVPDMRLQ